MDFGGGDGDDLIMGQVIIDVDVVSVNTRQFSASLIIH